MKGKYTLNWGIWRGTITSRDIGEPRQFDTRQEAIEYINELKTLYADIGYSLWFTNIISPDGKKEVIR